MYKQKLCISTNGDFGLSNPEQIKLFKKTGFEAFTGHWVEGEDEDVIKTAKTAKEENIIFHAFHAPWTHSACMWDENEKERASQGVKDLCHFLELCHNINIPLMVSHVYVGFDKPCVPTDFGLENYGKVIDRSQELGVNIAFENTEGEEGLGALLTTYHDRENIGFCWDSGHEMCYNYGKDLLGLYGDKLLITHINDNLGIKDFGGKTFWHDDLHLLPFDGIGDWDYNAKRLARSRETEYLTFELNNKSKPNRHENDKYFKMPIEEYVAEAYSRACKFASMVMKEKLK